MKKKHLRGNELRKLRQKHGLTVPNTAKILGVNYKTYWAWENDINGIIPLAWELIIEKFKKVK